MITIVYEHVANIRGLAYERRHDLRLVLVTADNARSIAKPPEVPVTPCDGQSAVVGVSDEGYIQILQVLSWGKRKKVVIPT